MVNSAPAADKVGFSIQSLEHDRDPRIVQAGVQALYGNLLQINGLEQGMVAEVRRAPRLNPRPGSSAGNGSDRPLLSGLTFEAPLEKIRPVLRCLGDWLDRTAQLNRFEITLPPVYSLVLQTDQALALAQLLPLVEVMLPPDIAYLNQAQRYVDTFGELTPAAKASLTLLQHRLGLSSEAASDLNARAMGPFKTLGEKYQHFRRELLVCKQESDLDADFWRVMQQKAIAMGLPQADVDFLRAERLQVLRAETDRARAEAAATAAAHRQHQQQEQQRQADYRSAFATLVINALGALPASADAATFHQEVRGQLTSELNRGRLDATREFYRLGAQEAAALEKPVLDELYLLSGLL